MKTPGASSSFIAEERKVLCGHRSRKHDRSRARDRRISGFREVHSGVSRHLRAG
jgi:hypothetical protein